MSATALFVTGLATGAVAGGATCAAVQGGLLAGAVGRRRTGAAVAPCVPARAPGEAPGPPAGSATTLAMRDPVREGESALLALGSFLGAKLVAHTVLGALLGAIGAAAEPSPRTRAILLLAAAALMVVFALDLLGVKAARRWVPQAPEAWTQRVRRRAKSRSVFTPALLGLLTVLLPCGVTLSVSLLAITSGSPVAGAAVMAGFVLGTMPLFAVLGFVLRQSTRVLQGRLSIVTGVVVLAVAVFTFNSALTLGGWGLPARPAAITPASFQAVRSLPDGGQLVTLRVNESGYTPAAVVARPGVRTTLALETDGTGGCTRAFVIASRGVQEILPAKGRVTLDLGTPDAGALKYTCGMGMYGGRILFQATPPGTTGGPA